MVKPDNRCSTALEIIVQQTGHVLRSGQATRLRVGLDHQVGSGLEGRLPGEHEGDRTDDARERDPNLSFNLDFPSGRRGELRLRLRLRRQQIECTPRLVVLGYDVAQKVIWEAEAQRLRTQFGLRVYAVGDPSAAKVSAAFHRPADVPLWSPPATILLPRAHRRA